MLSFTSEFSFRRLGYGLFAVFSLLSMGTWPKLVGKEELQANISLQAASHTTVLSILAAFTAGLIYLIQSNPKKASPTLHSDLRLVSLLFSLIAFLLAAFTSAILTGLATPEKHYPLSYCFLIIIYMLYFWGFALLVVGALYLADVQDGLRHRHMYCFLIVLGSTVWLFFLHQHILAVIRLSQPDYLDWPFFLAIATISSHEVIMHPVYRGQRLWKKVSVALIGGGVTSLVGLSFPLLNMRAFQNNAATPEVFKILFALFYLFIGLYLAVALGIISYSVEKGQRQ